MLASLRDARVKVAPCRLTRSKRAPVRSCSLNSVMGTAATAGMLEASRQSGRVKGNRQLPALAAALRQTTRAEHSNMAITA
jgi:hypothetical protein